MASSLTPEQAAIVAKIKAIGRQVGASPKQIKAALETGRVESNFSNPAGGDADSAGWRQERASIYKDPTNLDASIQRFYKETAAVKDQYGSAGALAAAVQRPAAQYRGRYQQVAGEAQGLLGGFQGPAAASGSIQPVGAVGGVNNDPARRALIASFIQGGNPAFTQGTAADGISAHDPLSLALGLKGLADVPGRTPTSTSAKASTGVSGGSGDLTAQLVSRANAINAKKLPYQWGGGHGGKVDAYKAQPLDCSGAVSAVLGINPRVSGEFTTWGKAGDGGNRGVTVYANGHHVLMKVNNHFFGTSASNPGGGAGWIPQSQISPEYLKGFTARHL